jgi:hypothetical protein
LDFLLTVRVAFHFVEKSAGPFGQLALGLFPGMDEHRRYAHQVGENRLTGPDFSRVLRTVGFGSSGKSTVRTVNRG